MCVLSSTASKPEISTNEPFFNDATDAGYVAVLHIRSIPTRT